MSSFRTLIGVAMADLPSLGITEYVLQYLPFLLSLTLPLNNFFSYRELLQLRLRNSEPLTYFLAGSR